MFNGYFRWANPVVLSKARRLWLRLQGASWRSGLLQAKSCKNMAEEMGLASRSSLKKYKASQNHRWGEKQRFLPSLLPTRQKKKGMCLAPDLKGALVQVKN